MCEADLRFFIPFRDLKHNFCALPFAFVFGEIKIVVRHIHRSFIVAKDKIEAFSATEVEVGGKQLPIGRSYKELVTGLLENNGTAGLDERPFTADLSHV